MTGIIFDEEVKEGLSEEMTVEMGPEEIREGVS